MNRSRARTWIPVAGGVALLSLGACADREHIRDDFGLRTRAFLQKQHVHSEAAMDSPTGLDSEEASLIQGTYRKDLGQGSGRGEESGDVMMIQQSKQPAKGK